MRRLCLFLLRWARYRTAVRHAERLVWRGESAAGMAMLQKRLGRRLSARAWDRVAANRHDRSTERSE